jgi:hypothetical protein
VINPLADYPGIRKAGYTLLWTIGIALGAISVGYGSTDNSTPDWLKAALAVYAFLGGALGFTASQHTPVSDDSADDAEISSHYIDGPEGADA